MRCTIMQLLLFLVLVVGPIWHGTMAIPIENRVIGQPEVRCGIEVITVLIHTDVPFKGRIYVEGESELNDCAHNYAEGSLESGYDSKAAEFSIHFGECNMRRQRTLNPRGVAYSFTLIVSFHPIFLTGVDRAFHVRCFFMEAVKAVETAIDVNKLTTEIIDENFVLPQCTYHLKQNPGGPYLRFASVGDPVTHVWECDSAVGHVYGVLVHSCYVDDGHGNRFDLVDDRGCTTDKYLLDEINYDSYSISAHASTHVFKYADRVQLFFTCTVQLCFKDDGGCNGITPPHCGSSEGGGYEPKTSDFSHPDYHKALAPPPFRPPFPSKDSERDDSRPIENFPGSGPFSGPPSEPSPTKEFFGPIDGFKYFGHHRKSPPVNGKLKNHSFRPQYKDSPIATTNETHSTTTYRPLFTTTTGLLWLNKTRTVRGTQSAMETDLSVELTVLPLDENRNSSLINSKEIFQQAFSTENSFLHRKICVHLPIIVVVSISGILLIVLVNLITGLCVYQRRETIKRLKYSFCS